jgi:hypothetical protein
MTMTAAIAAATAGIGFAQTTPPPTAPQQQPAPPPAPPDQLMFTKEAPTLIFFQVAETSAPDFETVMTKVKEVLAKSTKPERQAQAATWKLLKAESAQAGTWTYINLLNPSVKDVSYDPFKILAEGLPPEEVGALYEKVKVGLKNISIVPLQVALEMKGSN